MKKLSKKEQEALDIGNIEAMILELQEKTKKAYEEAKDFSVSEGKANIAIKAIKEYKAEEKRLTNQLNKKKNHE